MGDMDEMNKGSEIDSYGVWVKMKKDDEDTKESSPESVSLSPADDTLPAVDEAMFAGGDDVVTLAPDLAGEAEADKTTAESTSGDDEASAADDFVIDENDVQEDDLSNINADALQDGEVSLDDFMSGTSAGSAGDGEVSLDDFMGEGSSDGDISLDDFMGEGFSAAEEKKNETPDEPPLEMDLSFDAEPLETVESDDIGVDIEDVSGGSGEEAPSAESELDSMNFDDFAEVGDMFGSIDGEQAGQAKESSAAVAPAPSSQATEEVDLSDFGIDANAEETAVTSNVEENKNKVAVVDYDLTVSTDDDVAEAPVVSEVPQGKGQVQNVTSGEAGNNAALVEASEAIKQIASSLSSLKNEIDGIKREMANMKVHGAAASEVPMDASESEASPVAEADEEAEPPEIDITPAVEMDEAAGLKPPTSASAEVAVVAQEGEAAGIVSDELPTPEEVADVSGEGGESSEDSGGFFSDDEGDDAIALSGDELTNMMSNAVIDEDEAEPPAEAASTEESADVSDNGIASEATKESSNRNDEGSAEELPEDISVPSADDMFAEPVAGEVNEAAGLVSDELPALEEVADVSGEGVESSEDNGGFFSDDEGDDAIALSGDELTNMMSNAVIDEGDAEPPLDAASTEESAEPVVVEEAEESGISEGYDALDKGFEEDSAKEESTGEAEADFGEDFAGETEETATEDVSEASPVAEADEEAEPPEIDITPDVETDLAAGIASDELPTAEEVADVSGEGGESSEDSGGFFSDDEGDDAIALSGDELTNMMSNAVIDEGEAEPPLDAASTEESAEPVVVDEAEESDSAEELPEEISVPAEADDMFAEPAVGEINDAETVPEAETAEAETELPETAEDFSADFAAEPAAEELPEEISVPAEADDMFAEPAVGVINDAEAVLEAEAETAEDEGAPVASVNDVGTDGASSAEELPAQESVAEAAQEGEAAQAAMGVSEPLSSDALDYLNSDLPLDEEPPEDDNEAATEAMIEVEGVGEAASSDEVANDAEAAALEAEPSDAEVPTDASEDAESDSGSAAGVLNLPSDLQGEVKAVLKYMDELLENLPEDKIAEFARSEQFVTYKKLFEDLGLS